MSDSPTGASGAPRRWRYVDGFLLPLPKKNLSAYRRLAVKAGKIWRRYGALDYKECAGDDLKVKMGVPFPRQMKINPGKRWCSRISYISRERIAIV